MKILGLLGYPVGHSYSKIMHSAVINNLKLDYEYKLFNIPPEKLEPAVEGIRLFGIKGVNVTVPHKTQVMQFLDEIASSASLCGAVNTIVNIDGKLIGHNTDYEGFKLALKYHKFNVNSKNVLVIGAGGAARAVISALHDLNAAKVYVANRTLSAGEELAGRFEKTTALGIAPDELKKILPDIHGIINTTTLGMYPNIDMPSVMSASMLEGVDFVYDIIYNPPQTALLKQGKLAGCRAANGIEMLVGQGAASFNLWTGIHPPLDVMRKAIAEEEENGF